MRAIVISSVLVAMLANGFAAGADHEFARQAVEAGQILPLKEILNRAEGSYPGQMIEAELESKGSMLVYDIKMLTPDNRVLKLRYDARTGVLIKAATKEGN
jgi:uncharacterized membrane protein YkoI